MPSTPASVADLIARAERGFEVATRRRDALDQPRKAAIDGVAHALAPTSMDRAIPPRRLLFLDLDGPEPLAAVVLGDPDTASHLTWQVSGAGIRPGTAMWGTAREVGELLLEQRRAGAPAPAVIAWRGYPAPGLLRAIFNRTARTAVERLTHDIRRIADLLPAGVHTALEAHSYGATLAAHALARLATEPARPGRRPPRIQAFATTGSAGIPTHLLTAPEGLGVPAGHCFEAVARADLLARCGRLLSGRTTVAGLPFAVDGHPESGLHAVTGHNTSRYLPGATHADYGYRDPGTLSLHNLARILIGAPPAWT
ncbi:alpha/beta hydrolase [Arthrobacter sp. JSM 101049]|uniref:alpha/beta hydrolase n=1 Tax=Arthrobacter sp. JSM 101049 TaxID=929097 RepID=UPI0035691B65